MKDTRRIDALIAEKVMGWPLVPYEGHGMRRGPLVACSGTLIEVRDAEWKPWQPSTDISAAWSVVDRVIGSRHVRFTATQGSHMQPHAEFYDVATGAMRYAASADTMPLAICLAALRALGVEVPND